MIRLIQDTLLYVFQTLAHNAIWLLFGITVACAIKVYLDADKLKEVLLKKSNISIPASVAFGAFTPFCACGTMAIIVSMLTTALPWGPIMTFLTSSPLMSPDQFIMLSGIISPKFAIALTLSSIIIGLASGYITNVIEKKTNFLKNQARFDNGTEKACTCNVQSCCSNTKKNPKVILKAPTRCCSEKASSECCSTKASQNRIEEIIKKFKLKEFANVFIKTGVKQVLVYFSLFAAVGYLINRFVPSSLILSLFGDKNIFAVPLAAILGLPLYVSGASSIPIIDSLMKGGASGGVLLAFMITGPGTSAGAIAGICTIMKKRAVLLYIGFLLTGAILLGYLYNFLLLLGI